MAATSQAKEKAGHLDRGNDRKYFPTIKTKPLFYLSLASKTTQVSNRDSLSKPDEYTYTCTNLKTHLMEL